MNPNPSAHIELQFYPFYSYTNAVSSPRVLCFLVTPTSDYDFLSLMANSA